MRAAFVVLLERGFTTYVQRREIIRVESAVAAKVCGTLDDQSVKVVLMLIIPLSAFQAGPFKL